MNPRISLARHRFAWSLGRLVMAVLVVAAIVAVGREARAQGKVETAAKALQKKAMEEDYIATEFAKAQEKLEKAIAQCGADKCSASVRARLKRDLGVVQIGGAISKEQGIENFIEALKIEPSLTVDRDFRNKEIDAAFNDAKRKASGNGSAAGAVKTVNGQPQGDFTHVPVAEQQIRTPIPVYVEYSGENALVRVLVRYKGFGMTDWKPVELKKIGENGWGGLIPCADVQQGATQYYLQGFNAENDPVVTGGDRNTPYKVPVKREAVADPPHLPNATPPSQCADTGDCPPNFPGCKKAAATASTDPSKIEPTGKEGGEFCEDDTECKSNQCKSSKCTDYEGPSGTKTARIWVGVSGTFDYAIVPSADDVCRLNNTATPLNDQNFYCVRGDGSDYPSRDPKSTENAAILPTNAGTSSGSDRVASGGTLGNIRLMLTVDYALSGNVLLGGRLGLVLNNYPGEAAAQDGKRFSAPVHLEGRVSYVFGTNPLFKKGLAPFAFGALGIAPFETKVNVEVFETQANGAGVRKNYDAWHIAGPAFVALGGGVRYAISPRFALAGGLRVNMAFVNAFAPSFGPELGGAVGF